MLERIGKKRIDRKKGWLYFLGEDGYAYKIKENADSQKQGLLIEKDIQGIINNNEKRLLLELNEKESARSKAEKIRVGRERIIRESGYLYFIDKEGYVARAKLNAVSATQNEMQQGTNQQPKLASSTLNIVGNLIGYIVIIAIIIGIAALFAPKLSTTPQLNETWVSQFFSVVGSARGVQYTMCPSLNFIAQQNYSNSYLNNNEDILAPQYLETENGAVTSTPYGVTDPNTYLQDLRNNDSATYSSLMDQAYSYYGFYIYQTEGTFGAPGLPNTTAPTRHVFVELSSTC
ncbi:MAG: hypothetical protein LVQ95_00955 [Candidatus Micrarchaeales archaeon]|nr:hypothetical protein [Candidatus Micrarchaeales archaeon]